MLAYSGAITDNFERYFMFFVDRYDEADIRDDDRRTVFFIILCDAALTFYYGEKYGWVGLFSSFLTNQ